MTGWDDSPLRVQVLGPIRAWRGGQELDLGSAQPRAVLAVLAITAGKTVTRHNLIDAAWENPSEKADNALYSHISRLRAVLEPDRCSRAPWKILVSSSAGYLLRVKSEQVDAAAFAAAVTAARQARAAGKLTAAARLLEEALAQWQGAALSGMAGLWARAERVRLEEARLSATEQHAEVMLALGGHAEVIAELAGLVQKYPLREELRRLYMLALYRGGRQADALAVFRDTRTTLSEDQGLEPGPGLQRLHEQMLAADSELDVPVLDVPGVRYSLPPDTAAFSGREAELDRLANATGHAKAAGVFAIGGMPGVGKTALAVRLAHRLRARYPDRQLFIDLHAHTPGVEPVSAEAALGGLLSAVGVDPRYLPDGTESLAGLWRDRMAGQRGLLVLDNAASSAQVAPLLPGSDGCLVLVTSRRHLGDLPGAVVPVLLDVLPQDQAIEMFLGLAARDVVGSAEELAELTQLAGFLPLAISLLARVHARHPSWNLADLTAETKASVLTLAAENNSVAAGFEVSYRYLPPGLQHFLRLLALHPGATIDACAAAALSGTSVASAAERLDYLHREALLIEVGYRRYGMHDLIRRFAQDHAAADLPGDRAEALERLLDYYVSAAVAAEAQLTRRPRSSLDQAPMTPLTAVLDLTDSTKALAWARTERGNLLACLDLASETGQWARVVALTAAVAALLRQDGPWADAVARHTAAVDAARHLGSRADEANALYELAVARRMTGQHLGAAQALEAALDIYRGLVDRLGRANALNELGVLRRLTGQYGDATLALNEALGVYRDLDNLFGQANALHDLGAVYHMTGEYPDAVQALERALGIYLGLRHRLGQANTLHHLGDVLRATGQYQDAAEALESALDIHRGLGNQLGQANTLNFLGALRLTTKDYSGATQALETALKISRNIGSRLGEANALLQVGIIRRQAREYPAAAQALDDALRIYRALGDLGGEAEALNEAGTLRRVTGRLAAAADLHQQALRLARDIDSAWDEAHALAGLARCDQANGDAAQAQSLLRQAQEIFRAIGAPESAGLAAEIDALTHRWPG
jgi:DNA-binding SARP family transcriptional activator